MYRKNNRGRVISNLFTEFDHRHRILSQLAVIVFIGFTSRYVINESGLFLSGGRDCRLGNGDFHKRGKVRIRTIRSRTTRKIVHYRLR